MSVHYENCTEHIYAACLQNAHFLLLSTAVLTIKY